MRKQWLSFRHYSLPRLFGQPATVEVYLAFDDPYSYVLVQALTELEQRYALNFVVRLTNDRQSGMIPEPRLWRDWALKDAKKLAEQYQLTAPKNYPNQEALVTAYQSWQLQDKSLARVTELFQQVWQAKFDVCYQHSTPVINHLLKNQLRQYALGHYSPATVYFAGEWFLGIDRLDHLERELITRKLVKNSDARPYFTKRQLVFADVVANKTPKAELDAYLSIRSPYSYLGLIQAKQLADHYQIKLNIKPVLPLMMRGFNVPVNKMKYLYLDTCREAKQLDIAYNKFCDPLGQGVINSYQLFAYADQQGKGFDYMLACYQAAYVNGRNLASNAVIRSLCAQVDLDYDAALDFNDEHDWNIWADANLQALEQFALWGVPVFSYNDTHVWGQDRLWLIEQAILQSTSKEKA